MISFYEWIQQFRDDNAPIGDLARDIHDDPVLRRVGVALGYEQMFHHMMTFGASSDAMDILGFAWGIYECEAESS